MKKIYCKVDYKIRLRNTGKIYEFKRNEPIEVDNLTAERLVNQSKNRIEYFVEDLRTPIDIELDKLIDMKVEDIKENELYLNIPDTVRKNIKNKNSILKMMTNFYRPNLGDNSGDKS